ncbi:MAG: 4-hydroxy-tetrahydrodipicolinate reductase [Lachnospiraceae bacterium]|nr:4-hydroxy-tetrahydrodipicolinate reductase [Lachnospiraceae bacterium]
MINILLHGCNGRMGRMISGICEDSDSVRIAAGIDAAGECTGHFPFFNSLSACDTAADVMIDFSTASAVDGVLDYCTAHALPLVLCTTGLSEEQLKKVDACAEKIAILRAANMSIGVNVLLNILRDAAPRLFDAGFDIEIVEKHHNQKLDAPSGTALALADEIRDAVAEEGNELSYVYDRSQVRAKRDRLEIGISAVRGGTIVGDHDVIFAGTDEVITLSHRVYSRAVFAKGAVTAAAFLADRPAGLYSMRDALS